MLKSRLLNRIFIAVAVAIAALLFPNLAAAQSGATLTLRHLETEAFPIIAGYLDARDASGAPIADLQAEDLQAFEDGLPQPVTQLRVVEPGLHIIVVLNPAEPFLIRDSQARTRYDYVKEQVLAWARALRANSGTTLSLITAEGVVAQGGSTEWINAFDTIAPEFADQQVSTQQFQQALELARQPVSSPGQGAAIWWITATPGSEVTTAAPGWQAALAATGIPLFVWQVDSGSTFNSESSLALNTLAQASGGQWFGFSGGQAFPGPEGLFSPFRSAYFFQYSSQLHSSGTHEVQLQMVSEGAAITSQPISFELDIRPPNPILVSPPSQINRGPSEEDSQQLAPFSQPIEILVEFPDEFERSVVRTALYVNETLVAENRAAPFTHFTWSLGEYLVSQQVNLRVEAEDALGLVGSSIELPVQIRVENPLTGYQAFLGRGGPMLAVGGIVLAALALFLVMVLSGRLRPARQGRARRSRAAVPTPASRDPLLDSPLSSDQELPPLNAIAIADTVAAQMAPAALQRLNMQDPTQSPTLIPLFGDEFVIGAQRGCEVRLQEESVAAEHARLKRLPDGSYQVADLGSEAGTWVNYAPVSTEGGQLRNDDLLHIGRVAFRFILNSPGKPTTSDL